MNPLDQIDALHAYLAEVPRDRSLSLTAQLERDAAHSPAARAVLASKILNAPAPDAAPIEVPPVTLNLALSTDGDRQREERRHNYYRRRRQGPIERIS